MHSAAHLLRSTCRYLVTALGSCRLFFVGSQVDTTSNYSPTSNDQSVKQESNWSPKVPELRIHHVENFASLDAGIPNQRVPAGPISLACFRPLLYFCKERNDEVVVLTEREYSVLG